MCDDCLGTGTIIWTEVGPDGKPVQKSKPCPHGAGG